MAGVNADGQRAHVIRRWNEFIDEQSTAFHQVLLYQLYLSNSALLYVSVFAPTRIQRCIQLSGDIFSCDILFLDLREL